MSPFSLNLIMFLTVLSRVLLCVRLSLGRGRLNKVFNTLTFLILFQNWLRKYGYLDASTDGKVLRKEDFRQAILDMRRFHGIPVNDEIDHEMIRIMNMPRCGFPDTVKGVVRFHRDDSGDHYERYKRYSLFGTRWGTDITYR